MFSTCSFGLSGNLVGDCTYLLVDSATTVGPGRSQATLFLFVDSFGPWLYLSIVEVCGTRLQSFAPWTLGYSDNGIDAAGPLFFNPSLTVVSVGYCVNEPTLSLTVEDDEISLHPARFSSDPTSVNHCGSTIVATRHDLLGGQNS